jgi:hypothetical protein
MNMIKKYFTNLEKTLTINCLYDTENLHQMAINDRVNTNFAFHPHYRGEKDFSWSISSTFQRSSIIKTEKEIVDDFINENIMHRINYSGAEYEKYWNALMHMQHKGGPTNLIDWSLDIQTALYFASEDETIDGKIWTFMVPDDMLYCSDSLYKNDNICQFNPFFLEKSIMINPTYNMDLSTKCLYERRLMNQRGRLFKVANNEESGYFTNLENNGFLFKYQIPKESKTNIRMELNEIGINKDFFNL